MGNILRKSLILILSAAAAVAVTGCNEYKQGQDELKQGADSMLGEVSELKDVISEAIHGTSDYSEKETSASDTISPEKSRQDAYNIENACKTFYSSVVSGTLNDDMSNMKFSRQLPSAGASQSERKNAAALFTVKDALLNYGENISTENIFYVVNEFSGCKKGTILSGYDSKAEGHSADMRRLTPEITLSEIIAN